MFGHHLKMSGRLRRNAQTEGIGSLNFRGSMVAGDYWQSATQLRRLASESDVAHPPALRLADRQRLDVAVIVSNLEAAKFARDCRKADRACA